MTTEVLFASVLAVAFVLMSTAYRGADARVFRIRRKGRKIAWDRPGQAGLLDR